MNKKENYLIECQEHLNQEKELNTSLTKKYDELLTQYETDKENYQSQHFKLHEKVRFTIIYCSYNLKLYF